MRLRVGIIGFGGFGQFLRRSWSDMDEVTVVAVADANPAVDAPGLTCYRDWQALVRDDGVDLVSIATPPASHAKMACAAMEAGKHVLIEKPVATTRPDAEQIIATQRRTSVVATVDFMLRFNPIVEVLQEWARRRPFGQLRRVLVENYAQDESLGRDHWFWDRSVSGGILVEHAVHFIDIVNGCTAGLPAQTDGFAVAREDGRVDRMGLTAVYPDGLVMTQYHAFSRPGFFETTSMRFVFDLAEIDVHGWIPLSLEGRVLLSDESESALSRLPGLRITNRRPVRTALDESRPAGWGASGPGHEKILLHSGGVAYAPDTVADVAWTLPVDKSTVYADCLRAMMRDVAAAVADPTHRIRVTLEDARRSLDVALMASEGVMVR